MIDQQVQHIMTRDKHDEDCSYHKDFLSSCSCGADNEF